MGSLKQDVEVEISGNFENWLRVKSGNQIGFVSSDYITTTPTPIIISESSETKIIEVFQQMPPTLTLVAPEVTGSISVNTGTIQIIAVLPMIKGFKGWT